MTNVEKSYNFTLIDGQSTPSKARNVMFALVNSKINFHSMKSFGITVRSSGDTSFHEKRIRELREANVDIKKVMDYAMENGMELKIHGEVEITLLDAKKRS
jgi:hypothetical protein